MMKQQPQTGALQDLLRENAENANYVLQLYVTGMTPRSTEALAVIKKICEERLDGRYDLEVIDIYQQPHLAEDERIIALPTLIKKQPLPLRRLVGNLADEGRVLLGLDLARTSLAAGTPDVN
jgi:circadian clock protein KaiB